MILRALLSGPVRGSPCPRRHGLHGVQVLPVLEKGVTTVRPRQPAPAWESMRPRRLRPLVCGGPAACDCSRRGGPGGTGDRPVPCANTPPLMRPAALPHVGRGSRETPAPGWSWADNRSLIRSIPQEPKLVKMV